MHPFAFTPWVWRDPSILRGGFPPGDPTRDATVEPDRVEDSIAADRREAADLSGYKVEATDGSIGSVDEATYDDGSAGLVVDTGPWIFGRKVLLPAGTVQNVDHDEQKVYVDRTKEQIKDSPEYDEKTFSTPEYRERVGNYYSDSYRNAPPV